jgi:hypothetical protein
MNILLVIFVYALFIIFYVLMYHDAYQIKQK